MSRGTIPERRAAEALPGVRKRWTAEEVRKMVEAGILREGSREFLYDGEIFEPMVEYTPHDNAVESLAEMLRARLPKAQWSVCPGRTVALDNDRMPIPDLVVLPGPRNRFLKIPRARDAALVVEVADTTAPWDLGQGLLDYAASGVRQHWVVDVRNRTVLVYHPEADPSLGFASPATYGLDTVVPLALAAEPGGPPSNFEGLKVAEILADSLGPRE